MGDKCTVYSRKGEIHTGNVQSERGVKGNG